MLRAIHTAATGMEAMQTNLDNISNNIANVNTTAYKESQASFHDLMYQNIRDPGGQAGPDTVKPTGVQVGIGVKTASVHKNFEPGPLKMTGREFDVAINGDGFFTVESDTGETLYTRDGNFQKLPDGRLVTLHGHVLQPTITVPQGTVKIDISPRGVVSALDAQGKRQDIGQIELVSFVNPSGLRAQGAGLYQISEASGTPNQGKPGESNLGQIQAGALEASNVNILTEMVNMIQAQRAYEMNAKAM